jgi:hypothetical protein
MDQLHRRNCFTPIDVAIMTDDERQNTLDVMMFLGKKRDETVKGRIDCSVKHSHQEAE